MSGHTGGDKMQPQHFLFVCTLGIHYTTTLHTTLQHYTHSRLGLKICRRGAAEAECWTGVCLHFNALELEDYPFSQHGPWFWLYGDTGGGEAGM